jgi:hypothetical protein
MMIGERAVEFSAAAWPEVAAELRTVGRDASARGEGIATWASMPTP